MSGYYRNTEGYYDPTAGAALSKIVGEENRKARSDRRKAQRKRNRQARRQAAVSSPQISTIIDNSESGEVQHESI